MYEVEIKARVSNSTATLNALIKAGFRFQDPIIQNDSIFAREPTEITNPHPGTTIMRIRREGAHALLNAKQHRSNELDSLEHETEITDAAAAEGILQLLGLVEVVKVSKRRWTAKNENLSICVDEVTGLGNFVELERLYEDTPPADAQCELELELSRLIGDHIELVHRGYDRLILENAVANPK